MKKKENKKQYSKVLSSQFEMETLRVANSHFKHGKTEIKLCCNFI